jgi:hypothetical protein
MFFQKEDFLSAVQNDAEASFFVLSSNKVEMHRIL